MRPLIFHLNNSPSGDEDEGEPYLQAPQPATELNPD